MSWELKLGIEKGLRIVTKTYDLERVVSGLSGKLGTVFFNVRIYSLELQRPNTCRHA